MPEQVWLAIGAVLGALVAVLARLPVESWLLRRSARAQYEWNAYQKLAETIGGPKGQILDAAFEVHRRIKNVEDRIRRRGAGADAQSWLKDPRKYYYRTFVYRLARLAAWIEVIRRELPFVDVLIPNAREEWLFIRHLYLIRETFTATLLFEGLDYDDSYEQAHIFAGTWAGIGQALIDRGRGDGKVEVMGEKDFEDKFIKEKRFRQEFDSIIEILQGLDRAQSGDQRWCFRWARVKAIHYACALLLARFGRHLQSELSNTNAVAQVLKSLDLIKDRDFVTRIRSNLSDILEYMGLERLPKGRDEVSQ